MNITKTPQKKRKGRSIQELIGIKSFSRYGLLTNKGELLFFLIAPTNISVMSRLAIDIKINHLYMLLSTNPELEIICSDSAECFDDNKAYLQKRMEDEKNLNVKSIIEKDIKFLDDIQIEMSTARQFFLTVRCKQKKPEQILHIRNEIEKAIYNEGFEVHRMNKKDIKRFLALYFDASMNGELISDVDGEQFICAEEQI